MDRDDLYGNQLSDQSYGDQTYGEDYTTYRDTYSYRDYDYRDYGQNYGDYGDQEDVNWGSVITGALLTALGGYLIYRGVSSGDRSYSYGDYNDQYGNQYSEDRSGVSRSRRASSSTNPPRSSTATGATSKTCPT